MTKKYLKAGLLTLVLVLPALIVLFLHGFSENHFKLPYYTPLTDSTGRVLMNGKDTLFYQVPGANDGAIKVTAFFEDSLRGANQQFKRIQKLPFNEVKATQIRHGDVSKIASEVYRIKPLNKTVKSQTILYNRQFILIDKEGFIRGLYDGTDPEDVDRLMAEIKILIDIYKKE